MDIKDTFDRTMRFDVKMISVPKKENPQSSGFEGFIEYKMPLYKERLAFIGNMADDDAKSAGEVVEFVFRFGLVTRIYMNGVLVFVGLQWRLHGEAEFIINSGVVGGVDAVEGVVKVLGITHYR